MTVLLKGYDVPKSCSECYMEGCSLCFDRRGVAENGGIHGDCPIIQIPPHGELIEREELLAELEFEWNACNDDTEFANKIVPNCIKDAPTVIESEEE